MEVVEVVEVVKEKKTRKKSRSRLAGFVLQYIHTYICRQEGMDMRIYEYTYVCTYICYLEVTIG